MIRPRRSERLALIALFAMLAAPSRAAAATISLEYDLLVHGSALVPPPPGSPPGTPATLLSVPNGTPMVIDVSFNTTTANVCGSDPVSGVYLIGPPTANTATVNFLGYDYSATGGIEINSIFGSCDGSGIGLRLFVGGTAVQTDPAGTQIEWLGAFGNLFLELPPSAVLGEAYPSGLPPHLVPFGGHNFVPGSSPELVIESTNLQVNPQPVPEPGTLASVACGALVAAVRRYRSRVRRRQ